MSCTSESIYNYLDTITKGIPNSNLGGLGGVRKDSLVCKSREDNVLAFADKKLESMCIENFRNVIPVTLFLDKCEHSSSFFDNLISEVNLKVAWLQIKGNLGKLAPGVSTEILNYWKDD